MSVKKRGGVSSGRLAAAQALFEVCEHQDFLEEALSRALEDVPRKERALAWFVAFGVLRNRNTVDAALRVRLHQPLRELEPMVLSILRCGTFERLFGNTPAPIIVSQWVEASRKLDCGRASNLINAVLRRVQSVELDPVNSSEHPSWLFLRWSKRYGREEASRWCELNNQPPVLYAVAPSGMPEEVNSTATAVSSVFEVQHAGPVQNWPGFEEGQFWIQDLSAVKVADLVHRHLTSSGTILDACAAPGGKSFRLTSQGHKVTAMDRSEARLEQLSLAADRLGFEIATEVRNWEDRDQKALDSFDAVLVDAPCSGLGTVRRHPEIRWRRNPMELKRMGERQLDILTSASHAVKPGGVLVYAVCSDEPEECEAVCKLFESSSADFERLEDLRIAPPKDGGDAHFAVAWRRR